MPAPLVVDASLTVRLLLPAPEQSGLQGLVSSWLREGYTLCAPALWLYQTTSALSKVVRWGELTPEEGGRALELAQTLAVQLVAPDSEQARRAYDWTLRLNRAAAYDSFYLALAESLQCDLWTMDERLHNGVNLPWVRWGGALDGLSGQQGAVPGEG